MWYILDSEIYYAAPKYTPKFRLKRLCATFLTPKFTSKLLIVVRNKVKTGLFFMCYAFDSEMYSLTNEISLKKST